MKKIKSVAIFAKPRPNAVADIGTKIVEQLKSRDVTVFLEDRTGLFIETKVDGVLHDRVPEHIDLVIVLGGDGTILRVTRALTSYDTPIVAVNLGGLGFLTAFTIEECLRNLEKIIYGDYKISSRFMLRCVHYRGHKALRTHNVLNDVVINKAALARIIQLRTKVNDMPITTYMADGLIVSSPTGSTAYSLAAGGPIITPDMEAMILTPICPHTLTNRPIVLGSSQKIDIQLTSDVDVSEVIVTLDGQIGFSLNYHDRVVVTRAENELQLIENPDLTFFDVLSRKLKWGQR